MKAYNLNATEREVSFGSLNVLVLGERGRGRIEKLISCPDGIEDGDSVSLVQTRTGKPKILKKNDGQNNKWLAHISTEEGYIRGAFGGAWRVGTWYDYLLTIPDDTIVKVKPSRGEAYCLAFAPNKVHRLTGDELEIFLDMNDGFAYDDWEVVE